MTLLKKLHSTLFNLSFGIKYNGLHTFHLPSIEKTQKQWAWLIELKYLTIRLNSTFKATIKIQHPLQMQYDNLKLQTPVEISPLPPKVYGNGCLLNNIRPIHLKGESEWRL
jgi:hypothetical protein